MPTADTREYETFDGQRLTYWYWPAPSPQCPPIVYLHGIESHGGWFAETAKRLNARGASVYGLDRRGSGYNAIGRGHCRAVEHLLVDVVCFLDDVVRAPKAHLLGLSWGGKLAFAFAQHYPERLASLVLVTPGVWPRVGLPVRTQVRVLCNWLRNRTVRYPVPLSAELFSDDPRVRHRIDADSLKVTAVTASFLWESRRLDRMVRETLGCPVPLCAVLSRADRIIDTPRTEQWLAQLTVPARHTTILDAGHAIQLECPDTLADLLVHWLAERSA